MFARDEPASYDLIFVDADHSYGNVRNDTELVLPLLLAGRLHCLARLRELGVTLVARTVCPNT
jgi:predicted O-methyltransferase YrrM